jgi:hypothetical protein
MLPRDDVSSRWNSIFDMLDAASKKLAAVHKITDDKKDNIQDLGLDDVKWEILRQVSDVLDVSICDVPVTGSPVRHTREACSRTNR